MKISQKNRIFFLGLLLTSSGLISCSSGVSTEQHGVRKNPSWRVEMSLPSGLKLSEDSSTQEIQLLNQVNQIDVSRSFFRDPGSLSVNNSPYSIQLMTSSRGNSKVYNWIPEFSSNQKSLLFAGCSFESGAVSCEYKPYLLCLQRVARESIASSSSNDSLTTNNSRSALLEWSKRCGVVGLFRDSSQSAVSFKIQDSQVQFEPSPLLSVLIYSGVWASYEDAVVQATAVATLPAVIPCARADGACLQSPVPISACRGCSDLKKGQFYTVFFLEALRQDYSVVRSSVFVP